MKAVILLLISILILFSCSTSNNERSEVYENACLEMDAVDLEMMNLVGKIKASHKNINFFAKNFEEEQLYWRQYRNRRLRALYPADWGRIYGENYGDTFNQCKCKEVVRMTKIRIEELNMYLEGGPDEQAECPSVLNEKENP